MATLIEKGLIELGELVEELQGEMETFEVAGRSSFHLNLIDQLATAVIEQTQLLRQAVNQVTSGGEYRAQ